MPVLAALGLGIVACRAPTQVDAQLRTDAACSDLLGADLSVARTAVEATKRDPGAAARSCDAGALGDVVLVPADSNDEAFALRVVAGFQQPVEQCRTDEQIATVGPAGEGCIVARRALSFVPHTPLELPIDLRAACVGVVCPLDQTCAQGAIVDVRAALPRGTMSTRWRRRCRRTS